MATLPGSVSLTQPVNGSTILASDRRNDNSATQTGVNGLITALSGGALGQYLRATNSTTVSYEYPPGYEYDYAEFTSDKTTTATTAAGAATVIAGGAVTYDGATAVWVEFFAPYGINISGQLLNIELYDGASAVGTICSLGAAGVTDGPLVGRRRLTPSAASHTYTIKAWNSGAGTGTVKAGAGGAGVLYPGYIRITKA